MNKKVSIIITLGLVVALGIILSGNGKSNGVPDQVLKNVAIRNGIQYITINAQGGYSPNISTAKAGIPTKLVMKTNGTYDCSAALVIRSIGFQKILPQTGETVIDLGIPKAGEPIEGLCGMGMYNFEVDFK